MFERLTKKVFIDGEPYFVDTVGNDILAENMTPYQIGVALKRLAAYEDTGLTPEEIKQVQDALNPIPFGRFHEIVEAEREGRLVVLSNKSEGVWERMESACGELEGFICECGHKSDSATNYCSNCGRKMSGGEVKR